LFLHLPEAPQGWRPFAPVLHLQQHELGRSLHLRTKPRVSPTPVVNHSSLRSGHPSTTGTLLVLTVKYLCTTLVFKDWARSFRNKVERCEVQSSVLWKTHDLGSLKRVQLKIYRSYDHEFLRAKTRLDMEQLRYRSVIEPPKIIPYYRLSLSTWPLSNNKELLCRFCRVKPGESLTTGSRYALSPHEGGTRVQHYTTL
jgi:hypothetical protein